MNAIDQNTLNRLALVHPELAERIIEVLKRISLPMRVTDGMRTFEEQAALYAKGRTKPGKIVTKAKPGSSYHNYGLAVDCCFLGKDPYLEDHKDSKALWQEYGNLGKRFGLGWGGDWGWDKPHLELTAGYAVKELKAIYNEDGIRAVWQAIDKAIG